MLYLLFRTCLHIYYDFAFASSVMTFTLSNPRHRGCVKIMSWSVKASKQQRETGPQSSEIAGEGNQEFEKSIRLFSKIVSVFHLTPRRFPESEKGEARCLATLKCLKSFLWNHEVLGSQSSWPTRSRSDSVNLLLWLWIFRACIYRSFIMTSCNGPSKAVIGSWWPLSVYSLLSKQPIIACVLNPLLQILYLATSL